MSQERASPSRQHQGAQSAVGAHAETRQPRVYTGAMSFFIYAQHKAPHHEYQKGFA